MSCMEKCLVDNDRWTVIETSCYILFYFLNDYTLIFKHEASEFHFHY